MESIEIIAFGPFVLDAPLNIQQESCIMIAATFFFFTDWEWKIFSYGMLSVATVRFGDGFINY